MSDFVPTWYVHDAETGRELKSFTDRKEARCYEQSVAMYEPGRKLEMRAALTRTVFRDGAFLTQLPDNPDPMPMHKRATRPEPANDTAGT